MSIEEKLTTVAENVPKVYEAGQEVKNRAWWDTITAKGTRGDSRYIFAYVDFNHIGGFNPPFQLKPTTYSSHMFRGAKGLNIIKAEQLDLSQNISTQSLFELSDVKEIELIDTSASDTIGGILYTARECHTVGKFILKNDGSQSTGNFCFTNCSALINIEFEGYFGANIGFKQSYSLSKASITSIVNALLPTASGKTLTLVQAAVTKAFGSTTAAEWTALVGTKTNWTISLA